MAVGSSNAVHSRGERARSGVIGLVREACRRLRIKVHAHKLKIEAIQMRSVGDEIHEVRKLAIHKISRRLPHVEGKVPLTLIQKTCSISKYLGRVSQSNCMTSPKDAFSYLGSSVWTSIRRVHRQRFMRWVAVALRFSQLASVSIMLVTAERDERSVLSCKLTLREL